MIPLNPGSISLAWGRTTSRAWRRPSSIMWGGPSKKLILACICLHTSFLPLQLKRVIPFHHRHGATSRSLVRTSENSVKAKFPGELTYHIAPALMLQVAGRDIGHSLRSANLCLQQEGIHYRAYLSIGVTSSSSVGPCGMSGGVISRNTRVWLCRILQVNFREYLFHALG